MGNERRAWSATSKRAAVMVENDYEGTIVRIDINLNYCSYGNLSAKAHLAAGIIKVALESAMTCWRSVRSREDKLFWCNYLADAECQLNDNAVATVLFRIRPLGNVDDANPSHNVALETSAARQFVECFFQSIKQTLADSKDISLVYETLTDEMSRASQMIEAGEADQVTLADNLECKLLRIISGTSYGQPTAREIDRLSFVDWCYYLKQVLVRQNVRLTIYGNQYYGYNRKRIAQVFANLTAILPNGDEYKARNINWVLTGRAGQYDNEHYQVKPLIEIKEAPRAAVNLIHLRRADYSLKLQAAATVAQSLLRDVYRLDARIRYAGGTLWLSLRDVIDDPTMIPARLKEMQFNMDYICKSEAPMSAHVDKLIDEQYATLSHNNDPLWLLVKTRARSIDAFSCGFMPMNAESYLTALANLKPLDVVALLHSFDMQSAEQLGLKATAITGYSGFKPTASMTGLKRCLRIDATC
ncbi:MAG: hypothetical protein Q4C83_00275 [Candidatus Saccharibacteria bacterium]|nr:hypothetical protein [Candidatus Saccharibacteria bacterium]